MLLSAKEIIVGARDSSLSRVQVDEVVSLFQIHHPEISFSIKWFQTKGDKDQQTSLSSMEKTDFFTREIDEAILDDICQIAIHSAKDLPDPLSDLLSVIAVTEGLDSSDMIVFRDGEDLTTIPFAARIGTSSLRREKNIKALRDDVICVDIRGTIEKRLALLDLGVFDGVIIANAALIRLKLIRNIVPLPGESAPMQGRLAIVAKAGDFEMKQLFSCLHRE